MVTLPSKAAELFHLSSPECQQYGSPNKASESEAKERSLIDLIDDAPRSTQHLETLDPRAFTLPIASSVATLPALNSSELRSQLYSRLRSKESLPLDNMNEESAAALGKFLQEKLQAAFEQQWSDALDKLLRVTDTLSNAVSKLGQPRHLLQPSAEGSELSQSDLSSANLLSETEGEEAGEEEDDGDDPSPRQFVEHPEASYAPGSTNSWKVNRPILPLPKRSLAARSLGVLPLMKREVSPDLRRHISEGKSHQGQQEQPITQSLPLNSFGSVKKNLQIQSSSPAPLPKKLDLMSLEACLTKQLFEAKALSPSQDLPALPLTKDRRKGKGNNMKAIRLSHTPGLKRHQKQPLEMQLDQIAEGGNGSHSDLGGSEDCQAESMPGLVLVSPMQSPKETVHCDGQQVQVAAPRSPSRRGRNLKHLRSKTEAKITARLGTGDTAEAAEALALNLTSKSAHLKEADVSRIQRYRASCGDLFIEMLLLASGCKPASDRKVIAYPVQLVIVCLTLGAFAFSLSEAIYLKQHVDQDTAHFDHGLQRYWSGSGSHPVLAYDAALSFGAFLGLFAAGVLQVNTRMANLDAILTNYASQRGFQEEWQEASRWDAFTVILLWICSLAERLRCILMWSGGAAESIPAFVFFAISSFFLGAVLFSMMRICRGLIASVDDFCFHLYQSPDFGAAERDWNLLQAVIRSACKSVQLVFVTLQTTMVAVVIIGAADYYKYGGNISITFSGALVLLNLTRVFLNAAYVTDHCERVPSFINSLSLGTKLDPDRMYMVWYIKHTQAGFYIFDIQLTSGLVLKSFYIVGACVFAILTKVTSGI